MARSVREHTERYAAAHGGLHPLTECWPWAEAIASWVEALPDDNAPGRRRRPWNDPSVGTDGLTLAIAESIRMSMALRDIPIGDLPLDGVQVVLRDWFRWGRAPGTAEWPAPDGTPHAARWTTDAELAQEAGTCVYWAVEQLEEPWRDIAMSDAWWRRLNTYGITYAPLADVAPLLGLTMPIQVREPGDFVGVPGLLVERSA